MREPRCAARPFLHNVIEMANGGHTLWPTSQFPTYNTPRVWLITSGDSPIGISLARKVLAHGDYVVSGIIISEFERDGARSEEFKKFLTEVGNKSSDGWKDRLRIVSLDFRCAFLLYQSTILVIECSRNNKRLNIR